MEATGVYWKAPWHVLPPEPSFELLLCNAQHVKNHPGRKTDVSDAQWLASLLECGLLRGRFVPDPVMSRLRDLTRYRKKLTEERARETQRIQKVLEDAGIKLDSVVSDVLGKGPRHMIEALIAGERDPNVLAEMALTRSRARPPEMRLALEGGFGEHHAFMLSIHFHHVDHLGAQIDALDERLEVEIAPFEPQVERLCTVIGIGKVTAQAIVTEIGVDTGRFPTAAHLASWAGMCPGNHESAGKRRSGKARKGNAARAEEVEIPSSTVDIAPHDQRGTTSQGEAFSLSQRCDDPRDAFLRRAQHSRPELCLVALVGATGSGKSSFAAEHFARTEVLSSDFCRGLVADDENDQSATEAAFEVLHFVAGKRLAAGGIVVVDATNVQPEARKSLVALAKRHHVFAVAIVLDVADEVCSERNATRPDRSFGAHVLRNQHSQLRRSQRRIRVAGSPPIEVTHERAELLVGGGCLTGTGLRRSDPAPLS